MKNIFKQAAIIALITVIGFSFTVCDDGGGGGPDPAKSRISFVSGDYELIIEKAADRSAFSPITGDKYRLMDGNVKKSWGDINVSSNNYTFTPAADAGDAEPFSATLSNSGLSISGDVVLNDGSTATISSMTMTWGPAGTWKGSGKKDGYNWTSTITVTGSFTGGNYNFSVYVEGSPYASDYGTYTTEGNTFIAYSYYEDDEIMAYSSLTDANTLRVQLTKATGMAGTYTYTRQQ